MDGRGPDHSLANRHSCLTPSKNEGIDINKVGPSEMRYSIAMQGSSNENCSRKDTRLMM